MTSQERVLLSLFLLCLSVMPTASSFGLPARPMPHPRALAAPTDSFLRFPAHTISQLLRQVQTDPVVRKRYARQFHLPESRIASYLRATLVAGTIPRTAPYTVYRVGPSGIIYPVRLTFPAGAKVFTRRDGQPFLQWGYGNPLARFVTPVEHQTIIQKVIVNKPAPIREIIVPAEPREVIVPATTPVYQPAKPPPGK